MASETLDDYAVTNEWTDLVAALPAAASVNVLLQCVSRDTVKVVVGGSSAPGETGKTGVVLGYLDSVKLNAANIWVQNFDGNGAVLSATVVTA